MKGFFTLVLRFSTFRDVLSQFKEVYAVKVFCFQTLTWYIIKQCNLKSCKKIQSKTNKKKKANTSSYYKKNQILSHQKNILVILQAITSSSAVSNQKFKQTSDYKGETNKSHPGRFRHIHLYFGICGQIQASLVIIQAYSV